MDKKSIFITGGTGFIGQALVRTLLAEGYKVSLFSKHKFEAEELFNYQIRAYEKLEHISEEEVFDVVINMAGESISDGQWTLERKRELWDSRVMLTDNLVHFFKTYNTPKRFIQISASGYYGKQTEGPWEVETEQSEPGNDFLAELCKAWEESAMKLRDAHVDVVVARLSPVFAREGGVWPLISKPYSVWAGNTVGDGRQPFPWIHRDDVIGALLFLIENDTLKEKVFNFNVPELITQLKSAQIIHKYLGGFRVIFYVPEIAVEAAMGEMSQLVIGGQFSKPAALEKEGYKFKYSTLRAALPDLMPKE